MNLHELIIERLDERGETQQQLAATLGVSRVTMGRWDSSLPKRAVLDQIAQALELPYPRVLQAALEGTGYATSAAELLGGLTVHVVDSEDRSSPLAVFTDSGRADEFVAVSNEIRYEGFERMELTVDGTSVPDSVRVYSLVWQNTTGSISQSDRLHEQVPDTLVTTGVGEVTAVEIDDPEGICELHVQCLDPNAGRVAVESARALLSEQGRLLPSHVKVPPEFYQPAISEYLNYVFAQENPELFRRIGQQLASGQAPEFAAIHHPSRTSESEYPLPSEDRPATAPTLQLVADNDGQPTAPRPPQSNFVQTIPASFSRARTEPDTDAPVRRIKRRFITIRVDDQVR